MAYGFDVEGILEKNMRRVIPYGHQSINRADIEAVIRVLKSDYLTQGSQVVDFENDLKEKFEAKYAVVFNSGTSALHAAYFAVGLEKGDEFILSPMTFAATANAGLYLGARPVFVDIDGANGNIDLQLLGKFITKKTKLCVPVHYGGNPCAMKEIKKIADKAGIYVIEDACHAIGARYHGTKIGSCHYSDITVFSFHPVKQMTTGEGGAAFTNNNQFYEKMMMFRTHGITKERKKFVGRRKNEGGWFYEMRFLGFNYRMTEIQAALGRAQLRKLDAFIEKRRQIAHFYDKAFAKNKYFDTICESARAMNSYHLYPILLTKKFKKMKKHVYDYLINHALGVQVHYIPVYWHPYYQKLGYKKGICPAAEDFYQKEISLPMFVSLTNNDLRYVVKTVLAAVKSIC